MNVSNTISLSSIYKIISFSLPLPKPRFLFALSDMNVLLRSGDLGRTWITVFSLRDTTGAGRPQTEGGKMSSAHTNITVVHKAATPNSDAATDDNTSSGCDSSESDDELKTQCTTLPSSSRETITCVACNDRYVALGGRHKFLALSSDKGLTFSQAVLHGTDAFGADNDIKYVCFAGDIMLAAGEKTVCSFAIAFNENAHILEPIADQLVCTSRICCVRSFSLGCNNYEVVVSEHCRLHFSWNKGKNYISCSHMIGFVRDITPFDVVDNYRLPPFPHCSAAVKTALAEQHASTEQNTMTTDQPERPYEYACSGTSQYNTDVQSMLNRVGGAFLTTSVSDRLMMYRYYFVVGTGTYVLENDYSCSLCVGITSTECDFRVICVANNMQYSPFTRSSMTEPVLCALATVLPTASANGSFLAARSNIDGVSFSRDLKRWSLPTRSLAVLLAAAGSGEFVVCERDNTVSIVKETESEVTNVIPRELHVRSLISVVSL